MKWIPFTLIYSEHTSADMLAVVSSHDIALLSHLSPDSADTAYFVFHHFPQRFLLFGPRQPLALNLLQLLLQIFHPFDLLLLACIQASQAAY